MTRQPVLLTTAEVAERLRTSTETVRRWVREQKLPAVTLPSGVLRFDPAVVDAIHPAATEVAEVAQ